MGRGRSKAIIPTQLVMQHVINIDGAPLSALSPHDTCVFVSYVGRRTFTGLDNEDSQYVLCNFSFTQLGPYLSCSAMMDICAQHGIPFDHLDTRKHLCSKLEAHTYCSECASAVTVVQIKRLSQPLVRLPLVAKQADKHHWHDEDGVSEDERQFPPEQHSTVQVENIIRGFCSEFEVENIEEVGCAACAQLGLKSSMHRLADNNVDLVPLQEQRVARLPLSTSPNPGVSQEWPSNMAILEKTDWLCEQCYYSLSRGRRPHLALSNGLWIGEQPEILKDLTFVEQLLIARARHNKCLVKIGTTGRAKMSANTIMFQNPTPEIFNVLPPSREELNEVLAYVFVGHAKPTLEDFKRTPMLVRRHKVRQALQWLQINHCDYFDLTISETNLSVYPDDGLPVVVEHCPNDGSINPLAAPLSGEDILDDTEDTAECRFVVHGLTGQEYSQLSLQAIKARALQHLRQGGSVLGIGHSEQPLSIFQNPQLYPQMFPCLFPFGYGGLGNCRMQVRLSDATHKKWLMNYFDKRFQKDLYFPMIAFNHEQIVRATTNSFLYSKRNNFPTVARRINDLDPEVLKLVSASYEKSHTFSPKTQQEKDCMDLLGDINHTASNVQGSMTSKREMRNEIWSLIKARGAPTWFITFSPADAKHPLSLYYAGNDESFAPKILSSSERNKLMSDNSAAAAKCFNFLVNVFIKHILGIGSDHEGFYGRTSAYYATVEQQGRLSLHLHALIWIDGALSPQEIRDRILSCDSIFEAKLVEYLQTCCQGEFMTGTFQSVFDKHSLPGRTVDAIKEDPTLSLPTPPPLACNDAEGCSVPECERCQALRDWRLSFRETVDNILLNSNMHGCRSSVEKLRALNESNTAGYTGLVSFAGNGKFFGCMNKYGECTARFPRDIYLETVVDHEDGRIELRKREPMMNTFTVLLTYLLRCNTDVTCILTGTAVKALVAYITDYISKSGLSTHHIFKAAHDVLLKNSEPSESPSQEGDTSSHARKLILKMVNSLAAKMEIGSPMASMYLLGFPDHYTNITFVPFWWRTFVNETWLTHNVLEENNTQETRDNVLLYRADDGILGLNISDDYKYRPVQYETVSVYTWVQCAKRYKLRDLAPLPPSHKQFILGHPLRESHQISYDNSRTSYVVPNFVGGVLPRKDQGDPDYFACVMLTLFKPWRKPNDLKPVGERSWSAEFAAYNFPSKHRQTMDNFNLVYECLDARDDFQATRKRHRSGNLPFSGETTTDMEQDIANNGINANFDTDDVAPDDNISSHPLVTEIDTAVQAIGWSTTPDPINTSTVSVAPEFYSSLDQHIDWKELIRSKRQQILAERHTQGSITGTTNAINLPSGQLSTITNPLILLPPSYFQEDYVSPRFSDRDLVSRTITEYRLNTEQKRAFSIVANHSTSEAPRQLLMYLGGMGGTGKTQVLRALKAFFISRGQGHRLVATAPTGSASSLLGGSTYHYLLGINQRKSEDNTNLQSASIAVARDRIRGIGYIFLDEVSMVACHELCSISKRLAEINNVHDLPFGGVNVIFSGDFAQLPPVLGNSLYSPLPPIVARLSQRAINTSLGLFYWHQVTTVVILKQNMRQVTSGSSDALFRTALQNMRTASCTKQDVLFLNSRVVNTSPDTYIALSPAYRKASIIVARNLQKDRLNELGVQRFASDTDKTLIDFYSLDREVCSTSGKRKERRITAKSIQRYLWNTYPSNTGMIPGKIRLCHGLPVLIKHNIATELNITNGQEAEVVGWQSDTMHHGLPVLDVVFVKLVNPPTPVTLGALPENVVPITPISTVFSCAVPGTDCNVTIDRYQIPLLPNFAMTDFASQGKTRTPNIVDLTHCRNHQSFYTCLSRGTSAASTVILKTFKTDSITKGASGWLRQELRALDVLDEITKRRFEGKLLATVAGTFRVPLIQSFRKSLPLSDIHLISNVDDFHSVDNSLLSQIQQAVPAGYNARLPVPSVPLRNVHIASNTGYVHTINQTVPLQNLEITSNTDNRQAASNDLLRDGRVVTSDVDIPVVQPSQPSHVGTPRWGTVWDSSNNSCAYDALLSMLFNVWNETNSSNGSIQSLNSPPHFASLVQSLENVASPSDLVTVRDVFRQTCHALDPNEFQWGPYLTDIFAVLGVLCGSSICGEIFQACQSCGCRQDGKAVSVSNLVCPTLPLETSRDKVWISQALLCSYLPEFETLCPNCMANNRQWGYSVNVEMAYFPSVLFVDTSSPKILIDLSFDIGLVRYTLRGLIYHGNAHFTSRFLSTQNEWWYHDGITSGSYCILDSVAPNPLDLSTVDRTGATAVVAMYIKQ